MSCALLLGLIWGFFHESPAQYCVDQPLGEESFLGDSINIPCTFSFPESINPLSVGLIVKAAQIFYCGKDADKIYNSTENYISPKYTERFSAQVDLETRTSSFTIKNINSEDEKIYCCRYILNASGGPFKWQSPHGSSLVVKGETELILKQEPFILALPGDSVTIVARFTFKNQTVSSNVTKCGVFRSRHGKHCGDTIYPVTCTQRTNESVVTAKVNSTSPGSYCFSITVSGGGSNYTGRTKNGSNLLVLGSSDMSKVNQTTEVEFRGPARINCSLPIPEFVGNRSVLWTQVYWMAGEPRDHFVYHPNVDYIDPEYKGKTRLIDRSDLLLEDFHGPDNTTLYCRVAIRLCTATSTNPNSITTILKEGPGTVIRVYDNKEPKSRSSNPEVSTIIIYSCVGCAVLLFLGLLIICLKTRRDNKMNNSRETIVESMDTSLYHGSAYENIEEFRQKTTERDEEMVYAIVTHSTTPKRPQVSAEPEVVYADVKKQ